MRELTRADAAAADAASLLQSDEPVVLRGLVADWPVVRASRERGGVAAYLRAHDGRATIGAWRGPASIEGRFDYDETFAGFNFTREMTTLASVLDQLEAHADDPRPPALYVGSTTIDTTLPRFRAENELPASWLAEMHEPLASLWLGNRTRVAAHQDLPDNLACVVAGRRRFTLLPPVQVRNLYVGPLEHTLAGQPTSLVDLDAPDLARFPRAAEALANAHVVELEAGDAVFIPSQWWHAISALEPINLLVNYWWRRTPDHLDAPMGALLHAMLAVRDLPAAQRAAWKHLFEHYVFDADDETAAHLPPHARQVLGPMDALTARGLRARLQRRLNR